MEKQDMGKTLPKDYRQLSFTSWQYGNLDNGLTETCKKSHHGHPQIGQVTLHKSTLIYDSSQKSGRPLLQKPNRL